MAEHTGPEWGLSRPHLIQYSQQDKRILESVSHVSTVTQLVEMVWPKSRNILQNAWPVFLMTVKVKKQNKTQVKTEKPSQTRGDWGDMITQCHVISWIGFWNRKRVLLEKLVKFKWSLGLHEEWGTHVGFLVLTHGKMLTLEENRWGANEHSGYYLCNLSVNLKWVQNKNFPRNNNNSSSSSCSSNKNKDVTNSQAFCLQELCLSVMFRPLGSGGSHPVFNMTCLRPLLSAFMPTRVLQPRGSLVQCKGMTLNPGKSWFSISPPIN